MQTTTHRSQLKNNRREFGGRLFLLLLIFIVLSACDDNKNDTMTDGDAENDSTSETPETDGDTEESADGDTPQVCHPGAWECWDDVSHWRCKDDGSGFSGLTLCEPDEFCLNGLCRNSSTDGDLESDGDNETSPDGDDAPDGDDDNSPDGDDAPDGDDDLQPDGDDSPDGDTDPEPDDDFEWPEQDGASIFDDCDGQTGGTLWNCLRSKITGHDGQGYDDARDIIFSELDCENNQVQCVYTGTYYTTNCVYRPSSLNCEHSWPQSYGADSEPARSDMYHLFPTYPDVNSRRSNHPFGIVVNESWSEGGSKLGTDSQGNTVFEPRDPHKGDVARAVFYFAVRYDGGYSQVPWYVEETLKQWNRDDPPSEKERQRNEDISSYQHNRNPFIDRPDFVDDIGNFTRSHRLIRPPAPLPGE